MYITPHYILKNYRLLFVTSYIFTYLNIIDPSYPGGGLHLTSTSGFLDVLLCVTLSPGLSQSIVCDSLFKGSKSPKSSPRGVRAWSMYPWKGSSVGEPTVTMTAPSLPKAMIPNGEGVNCLLIPPPWNGNIEWHTFVGAPCGSALAVDMYRKRKASATFWKQNV